MLRVYTCLVQEHDLRLVALAALVCALASFTAISLVHHVRRSAGHIRRIWLGVAAAASGSGIWATHFIAMLAFAPGIPNGHNVALTVLSLLAAMVLTGIGLAVALSPTLPGARWLGGAIVGGGIATMHYTGMAAFEVQGRIIWDPALVVVSIAAGSLIGAAATRIGLIEGERKWRAIGALLLTGAICSHHFTAMGAASIMPDPRIVVPATAIPNGWLAIAVALASLAILLIACCGLALDIRERRRLEEETDRMRGLANAAVEGLVVCDGETIVTANRSFADLAGADDTAVAGHSLSAFLPDAPLRSRLFGVPGEVLETTLRQVGGSLVPVELVARPVSFANQPRQAVAVRDIRARKKAEADLRHLAQHDSLTGLPNRRSFNARLDREISTASASGGRLALLCFDLDRFKEINDLFGHGAGDLALQSAARAAGDVLRQDQMLARLGGDEFAVIVPGLSEPAAASRIAEAMLDAFRAEMAAAPNGGAISASIGIAIYPDDAGDREALMSHADTALYRAKVEGRATYRFFEADMGAEVKERRQIEHDLQHAIARGELGVVYQPQKHLTSGEVFGFEALLRWHHHERGTIAPDIFIPIAEESGLILRIGEWTLRAACNEAACWDRPLVVAVNVSTIQLHSPQFPQLVHEILLQTGLGPHRLELEITETALIRDKQRALTTLRQLKNLGVRIAMDDFGTGYSSLSNLRAFPFDKIKIDGSFIRAVDSSSEAATIVRAVLGLGRGLGLPVLAEGVETAGELAFLAAELCTEGQGYFLGRPAPIEDYRSLVRSTGRSSVIVRAPRARSA